MPWELKNTVLIFTSDDFEYKPSIAGCGLLNTILIRSRPFPKKWTLKSDYLEKFQDIHNKGGSVVFFSNQYTNNPNIVKLRFANFLKSFTCVDDSPVAGEESMVKNIPVIALFALKKNCFKKPFTNLWKLLTFIYIKAEKPAPSLENSIYIGGYDGGMFLKNWKACLKNKYCDKQFITRFDTDRAFAYNIGVQFVSSVVFFCAKEEPKWKWNTFAMDIPKRLSYIYKMKDIEEPDIMARLGELPESEKYFILIMGRPSSGKTTLSRRILDLLTEAHIMHDSFGTLKANYKKLKNMIYEKTTILVTKYSDYKKRNEYIKIARTFNVPTVIIYLKTLQNVCKLLNNTKIQTSRDFSLEMHPYTTYLFWKKCYVEPEYAADDILVINYPFKMRYRSELKFRYSDF
jgi:hypothetical protein